MSAVPILMLAARAAEEDLIHGLKLNAGDYVTNLVSVNFWLITGLGHVRMPDSS